MLDNSFPVRISTALSELAGQWQITEARVVAAKNTVVQLCQASPLRWAVYAYVPATSQQTLISLGISTVPGNTNTLAPDLSAHPLGRGIDYRTWGAYAQQAFYAWFFGTAVNVTVTVVEVLTVPG